jgi:hypothetical protein
MGSSLGRGGATRLHRTATGAHWRTGALVAAGLCGRKHGLTEENPIQSAGAAEATDQCSAAILEPTEVLSEQGRWAQGIPGEDELSFRRRTWLDRQR